MVYKIAMIDDEPNQIKILGKMIERYSKEKTDDQFEIDCFFKPESFLKHYRSNYDVIFLDIQMPNISGMDIARKIRKIDKDVLIVFITNMAQYALESYEVHAYDFIMKPLEYEAFSMKFERICKNLAHGLSNAEITLTFSTSKKRVRIVDITYVEVSNHNLVIHLTNGEFRMRGTMTEMENKLSKYHFVKCNSCYLVNLKHVISLQGDYVTVDKDELKISHLKKPAFLSELAKYMGNSI